MSNYYDSTIIKNKTLDYQRQNDAKFKDLQIKKQLQINELNKYYKVMHVQDNTNNLLQLEEYHFDLNIGQKIIKIKMILEIDFPNSQAQFYCLENLSHNKIDSNTWQIKCDTTKPLKQIVDEIKRSFELQRPENDAFIDEMNRLKQSVDEQKILQDLNNIELKQLFPGVPTNQYKEIAESERLTQFIQQTPQYKQLSEYIVNLSKANQSFAEQLIIDNEQYKQQKKDLDKLAEYYEGLKIQITNKQQAVENLKKQFDKKNIIHLFEKELQRLDEVSTDRIEGIHGTVEIIDKDRFESDLKDYLELRKQYHKLNIKKEKFEQQEQ